MKQTHADDRVRKSERDQKPVRFDSFLAFLSARFSLRDLPGFLLSFFCGALFGITRSSFRADLARGFAHGTS